MITTGLLQSMANGREVAQELTDTESRKLKRWVMTGLMSVAAVVIAVVAYFGLMRTSYGTILRGSGGNAVAISRAGSPGPSGSP